MCCDDLAVDTCGDALCYARALTRLERLRVTTPSLALSSAGGSLLYRIQRLAGDAGWQPGPSKMSGILALSLGLVCFALNMQWARGQQPDVPTPAESILANEPGVRVDPGGVSVIHRDEVEYPDAAIEKGIQGTVVVEATLDADGAVSDARVLSGPAELRKAALQSVLQWHFTHDAAGSTRQISIAFQLPAESHAAKRSAVQARVLAEVNQQLAQKLAEEARNLQKQTGDASELQADARKLAEQVKKLQAERNVLDQEQMQRYVQAQVLEHELEVLRDEGASLAANNSAAAQMAVLEKKLAELREGSHDFSGAAMFAGRRLKTIDIRGLTNASRDELLAKLPVQVGDILAEDSMEKVNAAVKQFDSDLGFSMLTTRDGQVEIRINTR